MRPLLSELPLALGPKWVDPDFLIETFGTIGILVIVFIEFILIGIVAVSSLPIAVELLRARARSSKRGSTGDRRR